MSIRDVAKLAGVSPGTVSNVFTGKRVVSPDCAARVRAAAEALGYRPDRAASQLRAGRAHVIALLVPDLTNPFFAALIAALESCARREGYDIIVSSSVGDAQEEAQRLATLLAWRPAGVVVVPADDAFASRALLARAGVPFVVADRVATDLDADAVTVDNVAAGAVAAHHLYDLGHRDIVIAASTLEICNIRERRAGIDAVAGAYGAPQPGLIELGADVAVASERLAAFVAQHGCPGAFLALTNVATLGILATLQSHAVAIPAAVSVVGFDDYAWMCALTPPLTAVRQPVAAMGEAAWARLKARIDGDAGPFERVRLSCELIVRGSTAAPGSARQGGRAA